MLCFLFSGDSDDSIDDINIFKPVERINPLLTVRRVAPDLNRPNHFIALPITEPAVVEALTEVQAQCYHDSSDNLSEYMTHSANLHVTLCALRIDSADHLDTVNQCIYNVTSEYSTKLHSQSLNITGLAAFWSRVLYASIDVDEVLNSFVADLRKELMEHGIRIFEDETFVPHVTVLKFYKQSNVKFSIPGFLEGRRNVDNNFGTQVIEEVQLLSMEREPDGRYKKVFCIEI